MPGYDAGQPALYSPPMAPWVHNAAAVIPSANRIWVTRFVAPRNALIKRMSFLVHVAASADDPCDLGIFSSDLQTRIGAVGGQSGLLNATGVKSPSLAAPVPLTAGQVYYTAFESGAIGGTAAQIIWCGASSGNQYALFGTTVPVVEALTWTGAPFPLPASLTIASMGLPGSVPPLALLET